MATTFYVSLAGVDQTNYLDETTANMHSGTSSTSTDIIELRMGNGTNTPTIFQVYKALEFFTRWIKNKGSNSAGANLPPL